MTARLPPTPTSTLAWVPPPFARMGAMGKGARWLYIAHARRVECQSAHIGSGPVPATILLGADADDDTTLIYRGDVAVGDDGLVSSSGYGVAFNKNADGQVAKWIEGVRRSNHIMGWSVNVTQNGAVLTGSACPYGTRRRHRVERTQGGRIWFTVDGDNKHGPSFHLHVDGTLNVNVYSHGEVIGIKVTTPGGPTITRATGENGRISRIGEILYPNGDRATYARDDMSESISATCFRISERCSDPLFAGRVIDNVQWAHEYAECNLCYTVSAFWTTGHTECDVLFRDYVRKGLVGWPPAAQTVAMARIQQFSD